MLDLLDFRRQFILTNEAVPYLNKWQHRIVGDVHLFTHPDLEITALEYSSISLLLLGYIFDPFHPEKSNIEIISDVFLKITKFEDLFHAIRPLAGRYALIYRDENYFAVLHDPLGLREIYYCTQQNRVICGSQPNLINTFSKPRLGVTTDQNITHFYNHDLKLVRHGRFWVGDETFYQNVKHLMPNHYLDIRALTAKRYWPNRQLQTMELSVAVKQSCEYLKGILKAVTTRFKVMMAVTAGIDSRSLLAASRGVYEQIYYFINKEPPLKDRSTDIRIPRALFSRLNIPFHVHGVDGPVDEEFKKVFLNNTFMSTDLILPTIYNVYYKNHTNKLNLLGVGEIGRDYYGKTPNFVDGYYLAHCLKYKRSMYATSQCEKWLFEVKDLANTCNIDIMRLFLWEVLLGNWGAVGNSESDIAIEEFDPYDSHYIYEIMLSVNPSQGDIFEGLFREMWPELLEFPFNPPEKMGEWVKQLMKGVGFYRPLKLLQYKIDRWRFKRHTGTC